MRVNLAVHYFSLLLRAYPRAPPLQGRNMGRKPPTAAELRAEKLQRFLLSKAGKSDPYNQVLLLPPMLLPSTRRLVTSKAFHFTAGV